MIELIGPDHPIGAKISCARAIYEAHGQRWPEERPGLRTLLARYDRAIAHTWRTMDEAGIIEICTECATRDGGSCCGSGIERKFDVALLVINLLLGGSLPDEPADETGCWFLGPTGCTIRARHTICVNYLCKRLVDNIPQPLIHRVQEAIVYETDIGFKLEELIKGILRDDTHQ